MILCTLQNTLNQLALPRAENSFVCDQALTETAENIVGSHEHTSGQIVVWNKNPRAEGEGMFALSEKL